MPEPPPRPPPQLQPKLPPRLPPKLPPVKKIPSAPAVVAGAGARLLTSAPGTVLAPASMPVRDQQLSRPLNVILGPPRCMCLNVKIRGCWGLVEESEARSR